MVDPLKIEESPERRRLLRMFPELGLVKKSLYIGASRWRALMLGDMLAAGHDVTVVEAHPPNCQMLWDRGLSVIQGSMPEQDLGDQRWDIALALHCIEHIPKAKLDLCLNWLQRYADLCIVTCPCDEERLTGKLQNEVYGNTLEQHLWSPVPADFTARGWVVDVLDRMPDHPVPELLAYYRRRR